MDAQILATISNIFQILGVLWLLLFGSRTLFEAFKAKNVSNSSSQIMTSSTPYSGSARPLNPSHTPYANAPSSSSSPSPSKRWKWVSSFIVLITAITEGWEAWKWVGNFIIIIATIAWVAFKANVLQVGLLWYEVLIIGLIPSAIWIAWGPQKHHGSPRARRAKRSMTEYEKRLTQMLEQAPGYRADWLRSIYDSSQQRSTPQEIVGLICVGPLTAIAIYFIVYPFHLHIFITASIMFIVSFIIDAMYYSFINSFPEIYRH